MTKVFWSNVRLRLWEEGTQGSSGRMPRIGMVAETFSGSLHSPSVAFAPSESVEMTPTKTQANKNPATAFAIAGR
jgi:hypothetical protein